MEKNMLDPNGKSRRLSSLPSGRAFVGVILVIVGTIFMLDRMDIDIPDWVTSWPMIVVVIGLYIGAKNSFRPGGWMIAVGLGAVFTAEDILYNFELRYYLWPAMIIAVGLYLILKPRRTKGGDPTSTISTEDTIDSTSVFGGSKENIISKNFRGGEVTAIFGGSDLNLTQADIQGTVIIETTTIFGGAKIIVPAHWNLKSEVVCIFGGIDDKRKSEGVSVDMSKTLVLRGTCIFGGIDIKGH